MTLDTALTEFGHNGDGLRLYSQSTDTRERNLGGEGNKECLHLRQMCTGRHLRRRFWKHVEEEIWEIRNLYNHL